MKLKNLMFATMVAFAFASCSGDDEVPTPGPGGGEEGTAELTVGVAKKAITKASNNDDAAIANFSVLVFDAGGILEYVDYKEPSSTDSNDPAKFESGCMKVSTGQKSILVLANTLTEDGKYVTTAGTKTLVLESTKLTDVLAWDFAPTAAEMPAIGETNLMLSSQVISNIKIDKDKHYLIGYTLGTLPTTGHTAGTYEYPIQDPVKMYRNVAKINLGKIIVKSNKYQQATLTVKEIYALNGNAKTKIATTLPWGSLEVADSYGFFGIDKTTYDARVGTRAPYITTNVFAAYTPFDGYAWEKPAGFDPIVGTPATTTPDYPGTTRNIGFSFYAFENNGKIASGDNQTLLVIYGDFTYRDGVKYDKDGNAIAGSGTEVKALNQYYVIPIGSGVYADYTAIETNQNFPLSASGRSAYQGVMRNLEYNIDVTIKGLGSAQPDGGTINPPDPEENPDGTGFMDVKIEVVPYGQVTQNPQF